MTNFKKSWNNSDEVSNSQFHFLGDVFAADVVVFAYKLPIASSLTARGSEKRRTTESPSLGETLFLGVSFSRFQKTIIKKVITVETLSTTATFFLLGAHVFFPRLHAKAELECGTLLLFIHLNLAPAVKENESLMHCINFGGH